jgi:hypothetical protein
MINLMRTPKLFLAAGAVVSVLPAARAQLPNASQQVDALQQRNQIQAAGQSAITNNVPALYESESSDVGPQSVLQIKPRRTWIEGYADAQYFYTDNMFLADGHKQSADVLVSTVQAAVAPTPFAIGSGQLAPRVGYQQQWFNYGLASSETVPVYDLNNPFAPPSNSKLDTFDFSSSTVFGDIAWRWQNWQFTAGADYRRLLDMGSYNEFYREYVPRWGLERQFPLTPTTGIAIGYAGDYRVTDSAPPVPPGDGENFNDRTDHSLFIVGSWRVCNHAVLQPYYSLEYSHYTQINRDDWLNTFGLTLYCPLTKNITLRGYVGYDISNTDGQFAQDYKMLNAGGGINLFVRF